MNQSIEDLKHSVSLEAPIEKYWNRISTAPFLLKALN